MDFSVLNYVSKHKLIFTLYESKMVGIGFFFLIWFNNKIFYVSKHFLQQVNVVTVESYYFDSRWPTELIVLKSITLIGPQHFLVERQFSM